MLPRSTVRRIQLLRPLRPPNARRPFTRNFAQRPNLPYLSGSSQPPVARFLSVETSKWIKDEVKRGIRWSLYIYAFTFTGLIIAFGVNHEYMDRKFQPPREWTAISRFEWMLARDNEDDYMESLGFVNFAAVGGYYKLLIARLENPEKDGAGLREQDEGGILVAGVGKTGYDISSKSEEWRRGYYAALMGAARSAEHLDACLLDPKRHIVFPKAVVPGPSNPNPMPIPVGAKLPPKEEECEKAFEDPEVFYMRILTTHGFTEKQRVDAALAYAAWLDYKKTPNAALEVLKWAQDIASSSTPKPMIDAATGVIRPDAGPPSANVLAVATALAVHHATTSNLAAALPIFISVLRSRRSLVNPPPGEAQLEDERSGIMATILSTAKAIFIPPPYPPPPPDGTAPPQRTPEELCEEAGVMANIGEILYASKSSKTSKEDGLSWTREAVDIAEEQLRRRRLDKAGKTMCKQCLQVGLMNWETMIAKLVDEEKAAKERGSKVGGWFGFGGEDQKDVPGRWESEENVVKERRRRSLEVLERPKPRMGFSTLFSV